MKCQLCGKERLIYKIGVCQTCYRCNIVKRYTLKDGIRFGVKSKKEMILEFIENPNIPKDYLAKKYCVTIRNIDYAIARCCDKHYVRRDNENITIK